MCAALTPVPKVPQVPSRHPLSTGWVAERRGGTNSVRRQFREKTASRNGQTSPRSWETPVTYTAREGTRGRKQERLPGGSAIDTKNKDKVAGKEENI